MGSKERLYGALFQHRNGHCQLKRSEVVTSWTHTHSLGGG